MRSNLLPASVLPDFLLYNTLTRRKEPLFAQDGNTLGFYCCGPTVYGPAHIGNFRTFVLQDLMRRVAEAKGFKTHHVRNITDVDDKTIRGAQSAAQNLESFTRRWTERFHADCEALGLLPPHMEPRAVAHIPEQIQLISTLQEKRHAYVAQDGSVYFSIETFAPYGKLSGLTVDKKNLVKQARIEADEYDRRNSGDFALWKAWKETDGDCCWPSPWGPGRPGWHIECSAMSMACLGTSFDLHSGGVDLVFPHHENEIAQSEAATGVTFVRHWFHVNHLMVEGQKMSKSLGNLFTLEQVQARGFSSAELRFALMTGHYRKNLNFVWENLAAARKALYRLAALELRLGKVEVPLRFSRHSWSSFAPVMEALLNDLNTPRALAALFQRVKELENGAPAQTLDAQGLQTCLSTLGLVLSPPQPNALKPTQEVEDLARARHEAKQLRQWERADSLRETIRQAGWSVIDLPQGYRLAPISQEAQEPAPCD